MPSNEDAEQETEDVKGLRQRMGNPVTRAIIRQKLYLDKLNLDDIGFAALTGDYGPTVEGENHV